MIAYVKNIMTFTGKKETVEGLLTFLKQGDRKVLDFNLINSEPEEMKDTKHLIDNKSVIIGEYLVDGTLNFLPELTKRKHWESDVKDMIFLIQRYLDKDFQFTDYKSLISRYIDYIKNGQYGTKNPYELKKDREFLEMCKDSYIAKKKYGYSDWFEWRMKNWGCETSVNEYYHMEENETLQTVTPIKDSNNNTYKATYSFQIPWSIPIPIAKFLSKLFPVSVKLQYAGEMEGVDTGFFEYKNGRLMKGAQYLDYSKEAWISYFSIWGMEDCIPYLKRKKNGSWRLDSKRYNRDFAKRQKMQNKF